MTSEGSDKKAEGTSAIRISGTEVSKKVNAELAKEVAQLKEQTKKSVRLCVILVGERKDSQSYVRMKTKACGDVGIDSVQHNLPADTTQAKLLELVASLNADPTINGILIQLPLPAHINADDVVQSVLPIKDVDGLHDKNLGAMARIGMKAPLKSCTPLGVIELLDQYKIAIAGKHAVVLGRSNLVGKPVGLLLLSRDATVTYCHSKTADLPAQVKQADILIAAIGKAAFVKGFEPSQTVDCLKARFVSEWLKPGAVVIDVGTNAVDDKTAKAGYRLCGDCNFEEASKVASYITPVPGGVGPMTVAMLLRNTVTAFKLQGAAATSASNESSSASAS